MAAILVAEDKADTKIPLYTETDSDISMSTAPQHVTAAMWSLNIVSECTLCTVFFVNNMLQ